MSIKNIWKSITLNQRWRVERHLEYLEQNIEIDDEHDKENLANLKTAFYSRLKQHRAAAFTRNFVVLLLYVSVITVYAQSISPFIAQILTPFIQTANLVGFGVLSLLFLYFQRLLAILMTDLLIEHAHIVAIYTKHNKDFVVHPDYNTQLLKKA